MCQYLYASFSLKTGPDEGLTAGQADAVARWHQVLTGIAVEEMLHLALVFNVMTAIGAAPTAEQAELPPSQRTTCRAGCSSRCCRSATALADPFPVPGAAGGHGARRCRRDSCRQRRRAARSSPDEVMPRGQDFGTVGHLYRGASSKASRPWLRADRRACGVRRAAAGPGESGTVPLAAAHHGPRPPDGDGRHQRDHRAGRGRRGDWKPAHYGRFLGIWEEYRTLTEADPSFDPARPVIAAFTRQPYDIAEPQPLIGDPLTRSVAEVFDLGYETLLQTLNRFFTHTDETDEQLAALVGAAFGLMAGVLAAAWHGRLPGSRPGRTTPAGTAGPTFEMYYQFGNFVPWREPAWALLTERACLLAARCQAASSTTRSTDGGPGHGRLRRRDRGGTHPARASGLPHTKVRTPPRRPGSWRGGPGLHPGRPGRVPAGLRRSRSTPVRMQSPRPPALPGRTWRGDQRAWTTRPRGDRPGPGPHDIQQPTPNDHRDSSH